MVTKKDTRTAHRRSRCWHSMSGARAGCTTGKMHGTTLAGYCC